MKHQVTSVVLQHCVTVALITGKTLFFTLSRKIKFKEMVDKGEMWRQKIRFQQSPLFCCSEHFVETGDRKSLTGARRDLDFSKLG